VSTVKVSIYGRPSLLLAARTQAPGIASSFLATPWLHQTIMGQPSARRELINDLSGNDVNRFAKETAKVKTIFGDARGIPPRGRPV
jgi:hypothetical protein